MRTQAVMTSDGLAWIIVNDEGEQIAGPFYTRDKAVCVMIEMARQ